MAKMLKVSKVKNQPAKVRHTFTDEFMELLNDCSVLIKADFFAIWKTKLKNKYNISIIVEKNKEKFNEDDVLNQYNEWLRTSERGVIKAHSLLIDGLIYRGIFDEPEELLNIMKILYKAFE